MGASNPALFSIYFNNGSMDLMITLILKLIIVQNQGGDKTLQISEINTKRQFYEMKSYWNKTLNKSIEKNGTLVNYHRREILSRSCGQLKITSL
jgi:hypothetical protein